MDISSILPMLMKKNGGPDNTAANSNDSMSSLLTGMMSGQKMDKNEILSKMIPGDKGNLVNLMSTLGNKGNKQASPVGLKAIKNFAANDILGIMVKYFNT